MGTHGDCAAKGGWAMFSALASRLMGASSAQSMVEFALALPILLVTLVVGVQFAIIGAAALALSQANYQAARYAAVNTSADAAAVKTYVLSVASPTISANGGSYLGVSLNPTTPCTTGGTVTVSLTFDATNLMALPNPLKLPMVGSISFPTALTSTQSAFCEGSTN
jgi:Flp pilus assembly protein TadG